MESQIKLLKINVTNIKSTLIRGNKQLKKLRVREKASFNRQKISAKRLQKESFVEGGIPGSGMVAGAARRMAAPAMSILDRIKEFAGTILLGILINNLPQVIRRVEEFLKENTWLFKTIGTVFKITGDLFMVLVDIALALSPKREQLEKERKELSANLANLVGATNGLDAEATAADNAVNDYVGDVTKEELRQKTPEQVKGDVVTAIKEQGVTESEFFATALKYRTATKTNKVTKSPIVIPGVGSYERVLETTWGGGLFGNTKQIAKDTYGYEITPKEFEKRYQAVHGNWASIKGQLASEGVQGYSRGGTVKPATSSSGRSNQSFSGESSTARKARESTQSFTTFERNEMERGVNLEIQEYSNDRLEELIENFKELYSVGITTETRSSAYRLPSPRHHGPVMQHPPGQAIPGLGRIFGYVGSTGLSTGDHIHIETGDGYAPHDDAGKPIPHSVLDNIIVDGRPLHEYNMVSGVEMREHPVTGEMKMHLGYDYPIRGGAPIQLKGGLKYINFHDAGSSGFGKSIMIQDKDGNNYILAHLSKGPDPASLQPPSGENTGVSPVRRPPGYGRGGLAMDLTQTFDDDGSEVVMIMSQQQIIVPGPTRYITKTVSQPMPVPVVIQPKSSGLRSLV